MPINFNPNYQITPKIAQCLMHIEAIKTKFSHLSVPTPFLKELQESARVHTIHYSTCLDGHQMTIEEIEEFLQEGNAFSERFKEIQGYDAALSQINDWAMKNDPISESMIQTLHVLLTSDAAQNYRDSEIAIRDTLTQSVVYVPPEAKDISELIHALLVWIKSYPAIFYPLVAGIAHYQFTAIHPYRHGNGRTARLLTSLILYLGGYDLKGLAVLEDYYAKDIKAYYAALHLGVSHNYYLGRAVANITSWLEYFMQGMVLSYERVLQECSQEINLTKIKNKELFRTLSMRQRKILKLFEKHEIITASQIGKLFQFKPRTSSGHCKKWVEIGFLEAIDISKKGRKYKLAAPYRELF